MKKLSLLFVLSFGLLTQAAQDLEQEFVLDKGAADTALEQTEGADLEVENEHSGVYHARQLASYYETNNKEKDKWDVLKKAAYFAVGFGSMHAMELALYSQANNGGSVCDILKGTLIMSAGCLTPFAFVFLTNPKEEVQAAALAGGFLGGAKLYLRVCDQIAARRVRDAADYQEALAYKAQADCFPVDLPVQDPNMHNWENSDF